MTDSGASLGGPDWEPSNNLLSLIISIIREKNTCLNT